MPIKRAQLRSEKNKGSTQSNRRGFLTNRIIKLQICCAKASHAHPFENVVSSLAISFAESWSTIQLAHTNQVQYITLNKFMERIGIFLVRLMHSAPFTVKRNTEINMING